MAIPVIVAPHARITLLLFSISTSGNYLKLWKSKIPRIFTFGKYNSMMKSDSTVHNELESFLMKHLYFSPIFLKNSHYDAMKMEEITIRVMEIYECVSRNYFILLCSCLLSPRIFNILHPRIFIQSPLLITKDHYGRRKRFDCYSYKMA